jgi:energy-coupling factor transporter ATP-binding protein EcfA2
MVFQFPPGDSAERLVAQLAAADWCGEIVGPHGSGKSTLLETLAPHIAAAGRNVARITLRDGQRRLPWQFLSRSLASSRPLVIIDGWEQLSWLSRLIVRWRCRRASAGLLVTSHVATGLPILFRTRPSRALVEQLVSTLTARIPSPISGADVAASHACRGSNVRELFFLLYDRHERLAAAARAATQTTESRPA